MCEASPPHSTQAPAGTHICLLETPARAHTHTRTRTRTHTHTHTRTVAHTKLVTLQPWPINNNGSSFGKKSQKKLHIPWRSHP